MSNKLWCKLCCLFYLKIFKILQMEKQMQANVSQKFMSDVMERIYWFCFFVFFFAAIGTNIIIVCLNHSCSRYGYFVVFFRIEKCCCYTYKLQNFCLCVPLEYNPLILNWFDIVLKGVYLFNLSIVVQIFLWLCAM